MKAIAVRPGTPHTVHLRDVPKPRLADFGSDTGVLVKTLKVGVDATDREIDEALYGQAPPGDEYLVLGHECFGVVEEVGPAVKSVKPGDFVTATVRRPGKSLFDLMGHNDMTSDETYYERGISLLHGYLTEWFLDDEHYIVRVPQGLAHLGVLMEPASVVAKAIDQAYEAQRRLRVWRPKRAFVLGAGQIGLLATVSLRLRGIEVYTLARSEAPTLNSEIVEAYEATYVSTAKTSMDELVANVGKADLIIDATGSSKVAFDAMTALGKNGALVWTSVTGGDRRTDAPTDRINLEWVLGNKLLLGSVNGNRWHFEMGMRDLAMAEMMYPGVTQRILTHPVKGLANYREMMDLLTQAKPPLKVFVEVAS
ncbi:MAG TPA: glucose 1-dehydrogenase [Pirellulaceae bacterium]|jgi:threonine dehydrogenase-like Zn-dependent dehydrogenase|nr:glucose 1-dehydrogenase [Pirellulaceae bacterium]